MRVKVAAAVAVFSVGLSSCGLFGDDRFDFDDSWLPSAAPTMDDCLYGFGDDDSSGGIGGELLAIDRWIRVTDLAEGESSGQLAVTGSVVPVDSGDEADEDVTSHTVRIVPDDLPFLEAASDAGYQLTLAVFNRYRNEPTQGLVAAVASTPEGVHYFATQCGARNSLWFHERLDQVYDERIDRLVGETRGDTIGALLNPRSPFETTEPPGTIGEDVGTDDAFEVGLVLLRPDGHLGDRQICSSVTRGLGHCMPLSELRDQPWLELDAWLTDRMDENSYLDVVPATGYPATGSFGSFGIRHWRAFQRAEAHGGGILVLDLGGRVQGDGLVVGGNGIRVVAVFSADRLARHPELLDP